MNKTISTILKAGLLVGTLDILAAFLYYFIRTGNNNVFIILKYIAAGLLGKEALSGGAPMMMAGLLFHYLIAFAFTCFFFWVYPKSKALSSNNLLIGVAYGFFIWATMSFIVVPLSQLGTQPFTMVNSLIELLILIVCFGIPLSIWASHFYNRNNVKTPAT
jgi:hypothetical protein